jgi:quercetin dioxygenase-like cupin family protein
MAQQANDDAPPTFSGQVSNRYVDVDRALFVYFTDGGRTFWHTHPGPQTLIVTEGRGWFQYWGEEKFAIDVGDVIEVRDGEKHWHGAQRGHDMTHFATVPAGKATWLEEVSDPD